MTILENYTNKLFNKSIDACNDAELYKALLDIMNIFSSFIDWTKIG